MDSTGRFLLGGALGAALGYLLSQKNLEKVQPAGQVTTPAFATTVPTTSMGAQGAAPAPRPAAPAAFSPASPVAAPEQPSPLAPSPAISIPDWKIPPAPPADWRPAPDPAPAAPTSVAADSILAPSAPVFHVDVPAVVEPAESEIIVTREFLEEPLLGSGWRSTAPPAIEDETVETAAYEIPLIEVSRFGPEVVRPPVTAEPVVSFGLATEPAVEESATELPVVEDVMEVPMVEESVELQVVEETFTDAMGPGTAGTEALVQAASVASRLPIDESPLADDSTRVDDLKSRIEETRRRIRHELEQPFDISTPARPAERGWPTAPAAEPVLEEPTREEALTVESLVVETLPVEPVVMAPVDVELPVGEPMAEAPVFEEPVAVAPAFMESVATDALPMESLVVETLSVEPTVMERVTTEPLYAEPLVPEPAVMEPTAVEPVVIPPQTVEPVAAEPGSPVAVAASAELEVEISDVDVDLGLEEPVDYDSMKNRIESTRSRLKAKAFDAMMTGESALLGRDAEGASRAETKAAGVDSDIDETIETSLREEEE
jgi:hypothetical protein